MGVLYYMLQQSTIFQNDKWPTRLKYMAVEAKVKHVFYTKNDKSYVYLS